MPKPDDKLTQFEINQVDKFAENESSASGREENLNAAHEAVLFFEKMKTPPPSPKNERDSSSVGPK